MKFSTQAAIAAGIFIVAAIVLSHGASRSNPATGVSGSNVTVVDGQQIVTIKAKGGYQPQTSQAKAGMPTVLRFETDGTFDCSSTIRIPSLGVNKSLPPSGTTDVVLGTLQPGIVQGTCGMGMYRFSLNVRG